MNDKGKLKHRVHLMVFRRGKTAEEDVLVEHVVTHKARYDASWRRIVRRYQAQIAAGVGFMAWAVEEPYWREHGMAGRNTA